MKQSFEITLAGQKITVKTDASDEAVRAIVSLVDDRLERAQKGGATTGQKAALLVALGLAEDVVSLEAKLAELKRSVADEAAKLSGTVAAIKTKKRRAAETESPAHPVKSEV
ncbi:MAG: cell division protein ZapA [Deltaproteobacteria bacterium]|nr:cell division protein ZapA [Deltaproteobacteria bacterium]